MSKPRHILELNAVEKEKFLNSFDTVLSDCDGTIWMEIEPIAKCGEAINMLKNAGKQYKFISNNSMRTDQEYLEKLSSIGVEDVKKDDVVHPLKSKIDYINTHLPGRPCLSLCPPMMNDILKENGVNVITKLIPSDIKFEDLPELLKPTEKVAAVVLDLNINMTYAELALAQQYLLDKDCLLITGGLDSRIAITKDLTVLGPSWFVNILAESCNKEVLVFGKPGHLMGQYLTNHFRIKQPKRVLLIGDNLNTDIKFGINLGFQTVFVLTGTHTKEEMLNRPEADQPDYYADSMADFIDFFQDLSKI